jgi:predicted nucleic acid-binding protein
MPFVLDASVAMSWCFADEITPFSDHVLESLRDTYATVPPLWSFEVLNAVAMSERRGRLTAPLSDEFIETLSALDIRVDQDFPKAAQGDLLLLVRRHGLTSYDAAYLQLAKRRNLPLATLDRKLLAAASQEGVALFS